LTLPEYEYPVPVFVRNTFIDTKVERPVSLEEFFKERRIHSSPAAQSSPAAPKEHEEKDGVAEKPLEPQPQPQPQPQPLLHAITAGVMAFKNSVAATATDTWTGTLEDAHLWTGTLPGQGSGQEPPSHEDFVQPAPALRCVLMLSEAVPGPVLQGREACRQCSATIEPYERFCTACGTARGATGFFQNPSSAEELPPPPPPPPLGPNELPTVGSADHYKGKCKPCAFLYTKGCENGYECPFCHLCPPEEKRRRQKEKQAAFREMRRQRKQVNSGIVSL